MQFQNRTLLLQQLKSKVSIDMMSMFREVLVPRHHPQLFIRKRVWSPVANTAKVLQFFRGQATPIQNSLCGLGTKTIYDIP